MDSFHEKLRHVSPFHQKKIIHFSKNLEYVLLEKNNYIEIWKLFEQNEALLLTIDPNKNENIYNSGLSRNGEIVCISYSNEFFIFKLTFKNLLEIEKLEVSGEQISEAILTISFNKDESRIKCISCLGFVYDICLIEKKIKKSKLCCDEQLEKGVIILGHALITETWNFIVVCDIQSNILCYSVSNLNNFFEIPSFSSISCILPVLDRDEICIIFDNNQIVVYNLEEKKMDSWSSNIQKKYPINYLKRYNRPFDAVFSNEDAFIIYSHYNFICVNKKESIPLYSKILYSENQKAFESKNKILEKHQRKIIKKYMSDAKFDEDIKDINEIKENSNFTIVNRFSVILGMQFSEENFLIIISSPWSKILNKLPGVVAFKNYAN